MHVVGCVKGGKVEREGAGEGGGGGRGYVSCAHRPLGLLFSVMPLPHLGCVLSSCLYSTVSVFQYISMSIFQHAHLCP